MWSVCPNFSAGNGEAFGQKAKAGGIDLNLLSENGFYSAAPAYPARLQETVFIFGVS